MFISSHHQHQSKTGVGKIGKTLDYFQKQNRLHQIVTKHASSCKMLGSHWLYTGNMAPPSGNSTTLNICIRRAMKKCNSSGFSGVFLFGLICLFLIMELLPILGICRSALEKKEGKNGSRYRNSYSVQLYFL